jgi:hypothetical protein
MLHFTSYFTRIIGTVIGLLLGLACWYIGENDSFLLYLLPQLILGI